MLLERKIILGIALACATCVWAQDSLRVVELSEVVATGTRNEVDPRLLPMTVSVVQDSVLTERQETNILPTLVDNVPGLFVTQRGVAGYSVSTGGSGAIKIRGIGGQPNTDILVLIDGLPQYAGLYGHPIADNYQTMMAERVEVVRGPASMLYGSNAMGGVVNLVTRHPKRDTILSNIHFSGGSYMTFNVGATNQVRRGRFTSAVGFNYNHTDGHRPNMRFDQYNGFLRLGYDLSANWKISATGNIAYFDTHNPGTVSDPIEDSRFRVLRGNAALSVENNYDDTRFPTSGAIRAYYNGGRHQINEGHKVAEAAPDSVYNHIDFMAGISAYQSVAFFRGNRTTFGFDYQHFGGRAWNEAIEDGGTRDLVNQPLFELAAYVDFRQQIVSWLALDAGCRVNYHSVAGVDYAPQAGLSFILPKDAEIKAFVSRGFRNPTIRELYMYKPANDSLRAVSMWNYELSYRQYFLDRRLRVGANVFYMHAQNMIETRMIEGRPKNVNTGELKNAGCEVEINYNIYRGIHLNANYSYLYTANPILAAPEHKLNIALLYHHNRFKAGTSVQYINGLYTVLPTATTPGTKANFVLWDAHIAARIWKGLWVNIKADNILGTEYEINAGFPMPKTCVMAGFSWTF